MGACSTIPDSSAAPLLLALAHLSLFPATGRALVGLPLCVRAGLSLLPGLYMSSALILI